MLRGAIDNMASSTLYLSLQLQQTIWHQDMDSFLAIIPIPPQPGPIDEHGVPHYTH
jgi:hypothetical protein